MKKAFRTSTTVSMENTHLFVLSDRYFKNCFKKNILDHENQRKDFLMERIPVFRERKGYFDSRFKYIKTHVKHYSNILIIFKFITPYLT